MREIIESISRQWFLREPAYFALYCLQKLEENTKITCPVRCGQGKIEYNPNQMKGLKTADIEKLMRIELIRIFLKHPYERKPDGVSNIALSLGSDVTISDSYNKNQKTLDLLSPSELKLGDGQCYEWYARRIQEMLPKVPMGGGGKGQGESEGQSQEGQGEGQSQGNQEGEGQSQGGQHNGEGSSALEQAINKANGKADLWEEDELKQQEINDLIGSIQNWGSIPNNMVQTIEASTRARIDYRKIFQGFRGSILSSERRLTRMRPNRRTGFAQMGSTRRFNTKLLVAVDVSGSINDVTLSNFYGVINRMFKYGIQEIDCVQFDCVLGKVKNIRKAGREIEVCGRGGTSFQPIFDYLAVHQDYDGVVILTDGYAEHPNVPDNMRTKVLWVCENEEEYNQHKRWMELSGRVCWMLL